MNKFNIIFNKISPFYFRISRLNNTHLLKLLSDLIKTFFEITHEIENCLNSLDKQTIVNIKTSNSSGQLNETLIKESDNSSSLKASEDEKSKMKHLDLNICTSVNINNHLKSNQANQQVSQFKFDDEPICENVIPFRNAQQIKAKITQPYLGNKSIILKESNTIDNSNYYEISCSYIVQLDNFKNSNSKSRTIVEDKKTYISANINVNNCYKSISEKKLKNQSIESDEDTYSDTATTNTDYSDSLNECPSYNFSLKNKLNEDSQLSYQNDKPTVALKLKEDNNEQDINELIKEKMLVFNESLINLAKCENLVKSSKDYSFEIDKFDSNYLDFLAKEGLVLSLCTRLKNLVYELIKLMESVISGDVDETIKNVLNRNAELSTRLNYLRNEKLQIENKIKNLHEKESSHKASAIEKKHFLNEFKQNEDRVNWLKERIEELKSDINELKEEQRKIEFNHCEDEEIFQDCVESIEDLNNNNELNNNSTASHQKEVMLFNRIQFENVFKSIKHSSHQKNMMNLIDDEKFELNSLVNRLKTEIDQFNLKNEELIKDKQFVKEDFNQRLNYLKNLINSNKKFVNEQTYERDNEKDIFDTKSTRLSYLLKEKELSLTKCNEKSEFLKSDFSELLSEKDELQCKSYNQGKKLIDLNAKQDELKQSIDKLQDENNVGFYLQEQLRKRVKEYETDLDRERLVTDKLKFNFKLELDPEFYSELEKVMSEISKFQMKEKIREHLNERRSLEKRASLKTNLINNKTIKSNNNKINLLTPIKPVNTNASRSQSFAKAGYSRPLRTSSFSLQNNRSNEFRHTRIQLRNSSSSKKIARSKSFILNDKLKTESINTSSNSRFNHRYSLRLNDELFSKLQSPAGRVLDDEDFYSFKECQSLISLNNNDSDDDFNNFKSDSLYSSLDDEDLKEEVVENFNILNPVDAKRSLSEDTFYFSVTSEDDCTNSNLNDLYLELDRCKDNEKLKYYAYVISNFFQQITRSIDRCKDSLKNTKLDNQSKQVKVAELEKKYEKLKSLVNKEAFNSERLQNKLNNKHLEISELKNQVDSNQDNSLFIENAQILNELDSSMVENDSNQFILQNNLEHLEGSLKRKSFDLNNFSDQLFNLKSAVNATNEQNENLKINNQKLEQENLELNLKLKKLREDKLYKKLKFLKDSRKDEILV